MLAWTIYLSFAGALVLALLPRGNAALARWFALFSRRLPMEHLEPVNC